MCHKCVTMKYEFKHLKSFYQVDARVGISFFFKGKRYRYFCAKILEHDLQPNQFDYPEKEQKINEMLNLFRKKLGSRILSFRTYLLFTIYKFDYKFYCANIH